ncbi:kinase [Cylindrobasidium torrendii FP15055 ss-10]|uniref:Kinase n=1 Tax=Cylindrobasidium torrendii FP15055 ss-10 TaxID=1314674 RepID=A0A0D7BQT3_9AGAR|nr:kinase [Cylindrobasidium torrendii FP15055 ss-10]
MTLKAPKIPQANTAVEQQDPTLLTVNAGASSSAPSPAADGRASSRRSTYATLSNTLANLDMNSETKLDLRDEDLEELQELGQGNGGSVKKVRHIPSGVVMAKKIVLIDAKPAVRKQILRELQIMYNCHSEYIISFHGAYISDPNICICMEFGDKGSFDGIYKKIGAIDIDVVAIVAMSVLEGLIYLYDVHRIIHRDIKPSNILCNSKGQVKICDFGVSGELINSIADTFVGTSTYMSPERIQGAQYTVKSDVWSLGISLIELALGRFPFADSESDDSDLSDLEHTLSPGRPISMSAKRQAKEDKKKKDRRKSKGVSLQGGGMTMSILELLQHIVNEPAPRLTPEDRYPVESNNFIEACLYKDPEVRKAPKELVAHAWIQETLDSRPDMETWASTF